MVSGRTKAALKASAATPLPNSSMMYLTLTSPMMRERNVETMSTTVAEKTECACEGRSASSPRVQRERREGWDWDTSATGVDFTGMQSQARGRWSQSCARAGILSIVHNERLGG